MSEMLLGGQFVEPQKLRRASYAFRYPDAASALTAIYGG
jgi:NAD dependent epimerase/dehydratase family enzyme